MDKKEERRKQIVEFIERFTAENCCTPTVRDIQDELGIPSTSTIHSDIHALMDEGVLHQVGNKAAPFYSETYKELVRRYL